MRGSVCGPVKQKRRLCFTRLAARLGKVFGGNNPFIERKEEERTAMNESRALSSTEPTRDPLREFNETRARKYREDLAHREKTYDAWLTAGYWILMAGVGLGLLLATGFPGFGSLILNVFGFALGSFGVYLVVGPLIGPLAEFWARHEVGPAPERE